MWRNYNPVHFEGMQNGTIAVEISKKLKMEVSYNPAIPFLNIYIYMYISNTI